MSTEFLFKTRTLSTDYRVYGDDGSKIYPDSRFRPFADKAQWNDEPCAVMYSEGGKIYVAAFGLKRNARDFANRQIIFSFALGFGDAVSAWSAFRRVVMEWQEAGREIDLLLRERPGKGERGESISFRHEEFTRWLLGERIRNTKPIVLKPKVRVSVNDGEVFMPANGCVLKWDGEGEDIYCFRPSSKRSGFGSDFAEIGRSGTDKGWAVHKRVWGLAAAGAVIAVAVGSGVFWFRAEMTRKDIQASNSTMQVQKISDDIRQDTASGDISISGDTEQTQGN